MGAVKIGHASKDERGRVSGGKAGDQTGKEVCMRAWWAGGWNVLLRATDPAMREKIAQCMERAAVNDCIGYGQDKRNSLLLLVRGRGYDPAQATTPCSTDCSALAALACMFAGVSERVLFRNGNSATTSTLRPWLMSTGKFCAFTGEEYVGSPDLVLRGDLLVREGHHVVVVLTDGPGMGMLRRGSVGAQVRALQKALNEQSGAMLTVDGYFGPLTAAAVRCWQSTHGLEVDGVVGPETRRSLGL